MTKIEELMALADALDRDLGNLYVENERMFAATYLREYAALLNQEPVAVVYERAQGSFGITCLKPVWSGMKLYDHYEQAQDTTLMNLQDEVSNLTDELDQLRVDAMRYRWLTSNGLKLLAKDFPDRLSMMQEHTSDEIDAAVDAARGKSENL